MSSQVYGFLGDKYYAVNVGDHIVIPAEADYKESAQGSVYDATSGTLDINLFEYHTDMTETCNSVRTAYMKQYLDNNDVTEIKTVNPDFTLGIKYRIYNKDGVQLQSGTRTVVATFCNGLILDPVKAGNVLEYRKALILDALIDLAIPKTSSYGIMNPTSTQVPYTIVIDSITAMTTTGNRRYISETDGVLDAISEECGHHHASSAHYYHHRPDDLHFHSFAGHFVTNAHIGSTIIDSVVTSAELPTPLDADQTSEDVTMTEIQLNGGNGYKVKVSGDVKTINIAIEVILDNLVVAYDKADIDAILEQNATPADEDEEPTDDPSGDDEGEDIEDPGTEIIDGDEPVVDEL